MSNLALAAFLLLGIVTALAFASSSGLTAPNVCYQLGSLCENRQWLALTDAGALLVFFLSR
jgi:hypothetical protein